MRLNPNAPSFVPNKYTKAQSHIRKEIKAKMIVLEKHVKTVRKLNILLKLPSNDEFSRSIGIKLNISKSEKKRMMTRKKKLLKRIKALFEKIRNLQEEYKKLNIIKRLPSQNEFNRSLRCAHRV